MGQSISYDRILEVEDQLASTRCKDKENKGVVLSLPIEKSFLTIGALDNADHSTTAKGSLHTTYSALGRGRGEKSAQEAWKDYPEVTEAFLYMISHQHL